MLLLPSQATEEHPSAARLCHCVAETPGQDWTLLTDFFDTEYWCVPNHPIMAACAHDWRAPNHPNGGVCT